MSTKDTTPLATAASTPASDAAPAAGAATTTPSATPSAATTAPASSSAAATAAAAAAAADAAASASLYVGDLHPDITETHLHEIFQALGPLSSIRVCRDQVTRRSLGYAYVNFHNMADAVRALETMNYHSDTLTKNRPMRIMWTHRDPSSRKQGQGNIYVKGLDETIDNKCLFDTFSQFGKIMSCKVATDETGKSLGYGFVHFETPEAAKTATESVNGMMLANKLVYVGPFLNKREREAAGKINKNFTNVYVKNIDDSVCSDEKIRDLFAPYGNITSIHVPSDENEKPKGFAFINFESPELARKACDDMDGKEIEGKQLFVGRAQKKTEREMELRNKYEAMKMERMQKLQGVNLYVKNLSDDMDDEKLREEFSEYGTITSCKIMRDDKDQSRGFGFVCFSQPEEATKAVMGLNGRMIGAKPIFVALAERKEARRAHLEMKYNMGQMQMPGPGGMQAPGQVYGQPSAYMFQQPGMPPQINPGMGAGRGNPQFMNAQYMAAMGRGGPVGRGGPMAGQYMAQMGRGQQPVNPAAMNAAAMAQYNMVPQRQPRQARQRNGPMGGAGGQGGMGGVGPGGRGGGGPAQQFKYNQNARNAGVNGNGPANGPGGMGANGNGNTGAGAQRTDPDGSVPLTVEQLSAASPEQQKQLLGEKLFPLIAAKESTLAGKITGMLLEMENTDILHLLDTPEALNEQVDEALSVLMAHKQGDPPTETAGETTKAQAV